MYLYALEDNILLRHGVIGHTHTLSVELDLAHNGGSCEGVSFQRD